MENKMGKISELKEAIVKTIAFFDMFDRPLTTWEIWQHLGVKAGLSEVMETLTNIKSPLPPFFKGGNMETAKGFYFLTGRSGLIVERQARYVSTDAKMKRAVLLSRVYKFIPWIKLIAVGNQMGAHNLRPDGDIDLFIIAESGRVWLVRFFTAALAQVFGLRPGPEAVKNKICLSFFIDEEALNLQPLMINPPYPSLGLLGTGSFLKGDDNVDIYFVHWLAGLTPVYDRGEVYEKFIAANSWLKNHLPNWLPNKPSARRMTKSGFGDFYRDVLDMFFGGLESRARKFQLKHLPDNLKALLNIDTRVVASDRIIKLHANDRRREYRERYQEKLKVIKL